MDTTKVAGCFRDRTILVTGSTGFLAKLVVEKILRVQPDVKRLYLHGVVRAPDDAAAQHRVIHEIVGKQLFDVLRAKHGADFHSFIQEKTFPLAGDVAHQNLGLGNARAKQLFQEIDITSMELQPPIFTRGMMLPWHPIPLEPRIYANLQDSVLTSKCSHLKLLLHISTAYVAGLQKGRLLEKPLQMGQPVKKGRHLDIEAELKLVNKVKAKLMKERSGSDSSQKLEKVAMKKLGFKRAKYFGWPNAYAFTKAMGELMLGTMRGDVPVVIVGPSIIINTFQDPFPGWIEGIRCDLDPMIVASYEQRLPCFIGGPILDLIPGDMVVNAMMVAMATHYNDVGTQVVYHVTSALQNPLSCNLLEESTYAYCLINPRVRDDKRTIQHKRPILFSRYVYFYTYMVLAYKTRQQVLYAANFLLLCGRLTEYHSKQNRSLNYLMSVAKFYAPYIFSKGCFDDTNLRRLWGTTGARQGDGYIFNFDSNCINWRLYLFNTHIRAVLKVAADMKKQARA